MGPLPLIENKASGKIAELVDSKRDELYYHSTLELEDHHLERDTLAPFYKQGT